MLHTPPTNLLLLASKREPYRKAYLLTKNIEEFSGKKFRRMDQRAEKDKTERVTGLGRRTREEIAKVESNDSPEIPDSPGDIRHPWPPFR